MSEITLRKIVDELGLLRDSSRLLLMTAGTATANGDGAASTMAIGIVPYRSWRVINVGFLVTTNGASTVAETLSFGIGGCDIDNNGDVDYFGTFAQDTTANKNVTASDMFQRVNYDYLKTPDAAQQAGTPVWSAGSPDGFLQWQSKQGVIAVTKNNVAGSTFTARGWALIEIGEV